MVWLDLWYINHCWLFNLKSCFYVCIKYIWFLNSFCRYICKRTHSFEYSYIVSIIYIELEYFYLQLIICLHTVKWFQVLLCNSNNVTSVICLHTVKLLQVLVFNTNYSIQLYSFICTRLNGSEYCYVSQFN